MKYFGSQSVFDLIGNNIVYRNLEPLDDRLPGWKNIHDDIGFPLRPHPRKTSIPYAKAILKILEEAVHLRPGDAEINSLIFIGDTEYNDSQAFSNLVNESGWKGMNFIGRDKMDTSPFMKIHEQENKTICVSSRWELLYEFADLCERKNIPLNEQTAVIVDLDKTLMGARGRNDKLIDNARVSAALFTARSLFNQENDIQNFQNAYNTLNQIDYHSFTGDNQDYLVYICLMVCAGHADLENLKRSTGTASLFSFEKFVDEMNILKSKMSTGILLVHNDFLAAFEEGDPTPMKSFRMNEFRNTLAKMKAVSDESDPGDMLQKEIVLTYEVINVLTEWKKNGVLLFGLSDKPDEASIPSAEMEKEGLVPIHKAVTHILGMC
ncbi:MAG: hypothetical protein JXA19_07185 [Anaerolineales bacterium]|nr:hypothetical protein [Anaerolineales bacterium]